ncbi:MAG TPA: hypothetical protein VGN07_01490 [Steroidobacteraceae bacterium]|jgi:hypothetical protein
MSEFIKKMHGQLTEKRDMLRKRRTALRTHAERLSAFFSELDGLGCEPYITEDWMYVSLSGDKHKFLAFVRCLRKHGFKVDPIEKGATGFTQFCRELENLPIYVQFSSTVCRRVKVGTKTIEQDVFETVCDELMPYGEVTPESATANDIPF